MSMLRRSQSWNSILSALVILTGASAHAQIVRERHLGAQDGESFGRTCANIGDIDGDGIDDFIVGAPNWDSSSSLDAGRGVLFSGATGAKIREVDGTQPSDYFGLSVAGAKDLDGDGVPDYVIGSPYANVNGGSLTGLVDVFSGRTGGFLWGVYGSSSNTRLGNSVAIIGDVNGNGTADVLVGSSSNWISVYEGSSGALIHHFTGSDGFGYAVTGCGDLDGDGVRDILVGIPYADLFPFLDYGRVIAFSGATGLYLYNLWGTNPGDYLGAVLAPLGDVDQDGVEDYLTASPYSSANGTYSGLVRVVSGSSGITIREHTGDSANELFGSSICGMKDVDRDGVPDYAVGAVDGGNGLAGLVRVYSGRTGTVIYERSGNAASNINLGVSVASGDWNGDGVGDLLVGDESYYDPASNHYTGAVEIELMCPAWWANYGTGWAGKHGIPKLTALDVPALGAPLGLQLDNSLGASTVALLFVGLQTAYVPFPNSGTLLVSPLVRMLLPLPASGLTLNGALPNDPTLAFLDLYLQALEADSFATRGISFTQGLQLHCGFDL